LKETLEKCDHCGAYTKDRYAGVGWVHIDASSGTGVRITISKGRGKDGVAETIYKTSYPDPLDFCDIQCMLKFLGYEVKNAR
jgi:hypothetical protein